MMPCRVSAQISRPLRDAGLAPPNLLIKSAVGGVRGLTERERERESFNPIPPASRAIRADEFRPRG